MPVWLDRLLTVQKGPVPVQTGLMATRCRVTAYISDWPESRKGACCQLPLTLVPGCPCGTGGNKDNQLLTSSLL